MALRVSAAMALCLLISLVAAVAHSIPLEEASVVVTNASYAAATAAEVHAVPDGEELLIFPSTNDVVLTEKMVEFVAEPDPDRSLPSSDGEEELTKLVAAEKTEDQIEDGQDEEEEEKKKIKKRHGCDGKGKKEKKTKKKHHRSNDDDEEEEEETKKQIRRVEKKMKKRPHHNKNSNNDDGNDSDSDDEDEQERKARRWRKKAINRSMFGHGRRSQREEAAKEEVKN